MWRGFTFFFAIAVLGAIAPSSFGQYYYPPMQQQQQQYGQPGYMPYPPQSMYYQPQPMRPMPMEQPAPRVYNFRPSNETIVPANEVPAKPLPRAGMATPVQGPMNAQPTSGPYRSLPHVSKRDVFPGAGGADYGDAACGPNGCGPNGCGPEGCGPAGCGPVTQHLPHRGKHGHGHWIGELGSYYLVPYHASSNAFTSTTAGVTTTSEFPRTFEYGGRASLGYIFHNTWGGRFNYTYLNGLSEVNTTNAAAATDIRSTGPGPLVITGLSAARTAGIGTDTYNFRQRVEMHVGEFEFVKECHCFDTTLLFGSGVRYARLYQNYHATRSNGGGTNGGTTIILDQVDLDVSNTFEGLGPTVSFEAIHPICWGFALYGNARGSFLWGAETVNQSLRTQLRQNVVPTDTDTSTNSTARSNPFVSTGEVEFGLQHGCRLGRCYVFSRVGAVASRWWNVGSPNTSTGHLSFLGGTAMLGVTY